MPSANYRMADTIVKGRLAEILAAYQAQPGMNINRMAKQLYADYRIEVTPTTLKSWVQNLSESEAS